LTCVRETDEEMKRQTERQTDRQTDHFSVTPSKASRILSGTVY